MAIDEYKSVYKIVFFPDSHTSIVCNDCIPKFKNVLIHNKNVGIIDLFKNSIHYNNSHDNYDENDLTNNLLMEIRYMYNGKKYRNIFNTLNNNYFIIYTRIYPCSSSFLTFKNKIESATLSIHYIDKNHTIMNISNKNVTERLKKYAGPLNNFWKDFNFYEKFSIYWLFPLLDKSHFDETELSLTLKIITSFGHVYYFGNDLNDDLSFLIDLLT